MNKKILLLILSLLPILGYAKSDTESKEKEKAKVVTGFSGGMMLHGGYSFSSTPAEMFRNWGIEGSDFIKSLPKDGVTLGLGGELRLHLYDHLHLGAGGGVSIMPLAGESSLRTGWGGAFFDGYITIHRVRPLLGIGIGGGNVNRLFVPSSISDLANLKDSILNASYIKTPFFYIDPYIGLEILLGTEMKKSLYLRLDYMLPFGKGNTNPENPEKKWSTFIEPSGPRLYVGVMFGNQKRKK